MDARIELQNGVTRLAINGSPVPPFIFFFNTDVRGEHEGRILEDQINLAAQAGVHLYSFPLTGIRHGKEPDYAWGCRMIERFVKADPLALVIFRLSPGRHRHWKEWQDIPAEHHARFAAGTTSGNISIASEYFWELSNKDLSRLIHHLEAGPQGGRILGYHPGGPQSEMFHDSYREKGPDYSRVNRDRFRHWLQARYQTDAALREAWGRTETSLPTAEIPRFEPGRFPMHGNWAQPEKVFYDVPDEQDWIDFSEYSSEIVASRILDWAALIKKLTGGRKLTVFFYGYTIELPGSFSGHDALRRVLHSPDVDVLVSPCSDDERRIGGAGSFMSLADTVSAHGKLWLNEDDTRTHLWGKLNETEFNRQCAARNADETTAMLDRNLASILIHRAGTWWMDLEAVGAFCHPPLWRMLGERLKLYAEIYRDPKPYRPEVGVIVDERSRGVIRSDWNAHRAALPRLRDAICKSGTAVGLYSLDDFVSLNAPACRAYVFANAFYLTDAQIQAVRARLDDERAAALWLYAPGYLGPGGPDPARSSWLTGMQLRVRNGPSGTQGTSLLEGESWSCGFTPEPRLVVEDDRAEPLGRYRHDRRISSAQVGTGAHRSIFIGEMAPTSGVLGRLLEATGVHRWARDSEVIQTDGQILAVHCGRAGVKAIHLPRGVQCEPIHGEITRRTPSAILVPFHDGETRWFRLRRGPD